MKFSTRVGNEYEYCPSSNRIEHGKIRNGNPYCESEITFQQPEKIVKLENISIFGLEITQSCNLRCSYCCYSGEYRHQRAHGAVYLEEAQVGQVLEFIQKHKNNHQPVKLCFYGGEPLLKHELLRHIVSESLNKFGSETEFLITTNGTLLSSGMLSWISKISGFEINISFDGVLQDTNRKNVKGDKSYSTVYRNIAMIHNEFQDFYQHQCNFLVTIQHLRSLIEIADHWDNDAILKTKPPLNINSIAINYKKIDADNNATDAFRESLNMLYHLWDYYKSHPESAVMYSFFHNWLNPVKKRPVVDLDTVNDMKSCLPHTTRCFIDAFGNVAVCEKMCDTYRIGDIYSGINYQTVNEYLDRFSGIRRKRCSSCWAIRLCDTCFTCFDLNEAELDYDCKLQKDWTLLSLIFLCEIAEDKVLKKRLFS